MAENLIFDQQVDGFILNEIYGLFSQYIAPPPFMLEVGKTYRVVWDNTEYEVAAQDASSILTGTVLIGNAADFGFSGNGEPFAIVSSALDVTFFSFDTETSHTVAIYQVVEDETQEEVGIVIKNYSGLPIEYKSVEKVMFNTADGGKRVYSRGEALEDVSIELDFSSGDQIVKAADGTLVKSAIIQKPETLIPANIAEGVEIAGVIGEHSGGGGSEGLTLTCTGWYANTTYYHKFAQLNGTLYDFRLTFDGFGNKGQIYSYSEDRKTRTLVTTFSNYALTRPIELGGVLHLLSGKNHCTFDGTTFTNLANFPQNLSGPAFVFNGTILCDVEPTAQLPSQLYEWNPSTDTWSVFADSSSGYSPDRIYFVYDDELYALNGSTILYKWNGSAFEMITNQLTIGTTSGGYIQFGKYLYHYGGGSSTYISASLYRFNIETYEDEYLGIIPSYESKHSLDIIDGRLVYYTENNTTGGRVFYVNV